MVEITEIDNAPIHSSFEISEDLNFVNQALTKTCDQGAFQLTLQLAHSDPSTEWTTENNKGALSALRKLGLVAVPTTEEDEHSSALDRFICANLMNYHNAHPGVATSPEIQFRINIRHEGTVQTLHLPGRSRLILLHLATRLRTNIYVFTNRSKPKAFLCPGSTRSIGFYNCIDSYLSINTSFVLEPTSTGQHPRPHHPHHQDPPPQDPPDPAMSTFPATLTIYLNSAEHLSSSIQDKVSNVFHPKASKSGSSKHKQALPPESDLSKVRDDLLRSLQASKRLPQGVLTTSVTQAEEILGQDNYRDLFLRDLGKNTKPVDIWKDVVAQKFESEWNLAVSNAAMDVDPPGTNTSTSLEADDLAQNVEYRTCTVRLRSILRSEIAEHTEKITEMLTKSQEVVSDVVDELQLVVHKAVLAIASGQIYPSHLGPSQKKGFDVTSLLPPWFAVHASTKTVLDVAPLPIGLQQQLEDAYDKKQKSDLLQLFTKEHIQDLYSAFLGTQTAARTSDKSSWEAIKKVIRSESTTPEPKVEKADGLSRTMLEHITQVATSATELWSGSTYKKSLDQLLRILLRVHLAPMRENRLQERAKKGTDSGQRKQEANSVSRLSMGQWRNQVLSLTDELADHICRDRESRIEVVLHKLMILGISQPTPIQTGFESIEARYAKAMGETSTSEEPAQPSLDDIDEDENDDDDDPTVKETPARKLRSLKAICRTLLESAHIHKPVDASWVRKSAFAKDPISDEECNVVCMIVNMLRPYVPRRNHRTKQDGTKTSTPPPVVCLRAPIVLISNAVMHATKHPEFARRIAPHSSVGTPIALILGAPGIYETLCRPKPGYFDVKDHFGRAITNVAKVTSPTENKRSVLGGFFDIELVEKICSKHDLDFAQRIMFVDRYTIRLVGKQIEHGPHRNGHPVVSQIDKRRKENTRDYGDKWRIEFSKCGKSVQELGYEVAEVSTDVANLEKEIRVMKTEIEKLTNDKRTLAAEDRPATPSQGTDVLWLKKQELRAKQMSYLDMEKQLRLRRSTKHQLNMMLKAAPINGDPLSEEADQYSSSSNNNVITSHSGQGKMSKPTRANPCTEDKAKFIDISELQDSNIVFGGTDYGLRTMSRTVPLTMDVIRAHQNRYSILSSEDDDTADVPEEPVYSPLPPSFSITAQQVDSTTHTVKVRRKRQRKLRNNDSVKSALQAVSTNSLKVVSSMSELDEAQETRRKHRPTIRAFETQPSLQHDRHHQELRTKRAIQKFASAERRFLQDYGRTHPPSPQPPAQPPPPSQQPPPSASHQMSAQSTQTFLPILCIGDAGTGVGSRIKGFSKRGGRKFRREHSRHTVVAVTPEYRTSKTCAFCFYTLQKAQHRRLKNGSIVDVAINGALMCWNPKCPSFVNGNSISNRDHHAAFNIGLVGASMMLSEHHQVFPPFAQNSIKPSASAGLSFLPSTSEQDAPRARPCGRV